MPAGPSPTTTRSAGCTGPAATTSSAPSYDQIYNQLNDERINSRAQRYLRDLRRDAVIEFR